MASAVTSGVTNVEQGGTWESLSTGEQDGNSNQEENLDEENRWNAVADVGQAPYGFAPPKGNPYGAMF